MEGLRGRPAKRPSVEGVRELTLEEVRAMPRAALPRIKSLRDSHHMIARLLAMGLRPSEVAMKTGYSLGRVSTLSKDPSVQELIAHYRETVDEEFAEATDVYFSNLAAVRVKSMRQIADRLDEADETGEKLPLNQLLSIHADAADRSGYPKRREAVNLNLDFADRLERAISRSNRARVIEHEAAPVLVPPATAPDAGADPSRGVGREVERGPSVVEALPVVPPAPSQPPTTPLQQLRQRLLRRA